MTSPKAPNEKIDPAVQHDTKAQANTTGAEAPTQRTAQLQWNADGQPVSSAFDDVYFSTENGLDETCYVFLAGNQLQQRWAILPKNTRFTIVETGFGTGLNFLATWDLWNQYGSADQHLHFVSIERYPLTYDALAQALALWPELDELAQTLLAHYPPQPWPKAQTIQLPAANNHLAVTLTLYFTDTKDAIHEFSAKLSPHNHVLEQKPAFGEQPLHVDAWFLDGFAPSKNPDMWTDALYRAMAANSGQGTSFATFTAAGNVRRGLQAQGFQCAKRKGFGRKREMLVGEFVASQTQAIAASPTQTKHDIQRVAHTRFPTWPLKPTNTRGETTTPSPSSLAPTRSPATENGVKPAIDTHTDAREKTAIIIGAGLAGAHTANALAKRGIRVSVIDRNRIAQGASGNAQGAVYTRLSDSEDALSEFNLSAQVFADQFYHDHGYYQRCGEACGVLHLATNESSKKRFQRFIKQFAQPSAQALAGSADNPQLKQPQKQPYLEGYFRYINPSEMPEVSGLQLDYSGLFLAKSGWLNPPALCRELLQHKNIRVYESTEIDALEQTASGWQAHSATQLFSADYCVICNAADAKLFPETAHLPLTNIRGQVSHVVSNDHLSKLKTVVCGVGYLPPATDIAGYNSHCIGATFNLKSQSIELSDADHSSNLAALATLQLSEDNDTNLNTKHPGKVGFRCSTPDYFPAVGPVPVLDAMLDQFQFLSKKANADVDSCGHYYPGLYCSVGFGSRGLAYAPLAATLISNLICGDMLCVPRSLYLHLHPARFAIRSLIKNKPLKQ